MLAFLDNPVALLMVGVAALVLFGPQKLPELAGQLGRALRELKRSTSEITSSFNMDEERHRYDSHYDPPRYDSYGNITDSPSVSSPSVTEEDLYHQHLDSEHAAESQRAIEAPRGDFAASALTDDADHYGITPVMNGSQESATSTYGVIPVAETSVTPRPVDTSVPRS